MINIHGTLEGVAKECFHSVLFSPSLKLSAHAIHFSALLCDGKQHRPLLLFREPLVVLLLNQGIHCVTPATYQPKVVRIIIIIF